MKSPTIPEVEPQFEKEIDPFQQQVIRCETPTLSARCRSSIFEENLTPDPSVCRWLLDVISEDENMIKESVHFILSENYLIRVVAYTFDVPESQIQLSIEDEGCSEDDALLLLKADKSELIDAYSKTEDDELLALKLNISDQIDAYNKTEVDALFDDKLNISDQIDAYSKIEADALLDDKLNIYNQIDANSKTEDDALLLLKADKTELIDAYTKQEADALLDDKLNVSDQIDAYNKSEADALLDEKLNIIDQIDAYNKQKDDALLLLKADKTELADYVDLTSAQTITGQEQFGIISVSSISKLNKNDESILLAGDGDMLVSSLVSQSQLQEVRDIASGESKGYVFATTDQMNTWMEDQENVAKLAIGDNLYIVDKQIMDYWWDGSNLRALETELPDMSIVMTILGAATGGGNAITDLSFDGNTLIPAKNSSFITTNYDETITGQKIFNTTIHTVGISVQNYDNNSVVCAGGGVKAIQDTQDDALLLLKADKTQLIDVYSKIEADALLDDKLNVSDQIDAYTKTQDDALLLLKADKTQLIDSYTKCEADNLLNNKANSGVSYTKGEDDANKANSGVSYTKGEDDALLLLKADKTQLIDSYIKGEADNLLSNKANSGVSQTKGEDDALLLLKANQSTTYTKTETDYLISQIEVGDVDLSGYMTLGTSQTITANKTCNNACRFVSSINGMGTITGSQFVKSGADDSVVLLGAGGTKPISEFGGGSVDDSNYVKKTGQELQIIHGVLRIDDDELSMSEYDKDYLTRGEIYNAFVCRYDNQTIYGTKTFNSNVSAAGFAKTGKDDTLILLAGGGYQLLSSFGGVQVEDITNLVVNLDSNITFNYLKFTRIGIFYTLMMEIQPKTQINISTQTTICTVGSISNSITPPTPPSTTYPISFAMKRKTLTQAWVLMMMLAYNSVGCFDASANNYAAGLSYFPELYAYIKERYPKPLEQQPQSVPIRNQTLQQQVKNNDDIIYASNEKFEPPMPNAITKLDLSTQLERQSFLASSGSDQQLVVYGDGITLTASYATTGVFPNGYLFQSYPQEARPKQGDQVIALVGTDASNTYNIFCYIDQGVPFIISSRWLPSNTALVLNITYYRNYESSKKINYDSNNDGKIDIMDTWNVNGNGQFEAQSYVYKTVKNQTNLIEAVVQGLNRTNYLNSEIKLMDELARYKADRAAYFIKDGPFITYSFRAKLTQLGANYEAQQTVYKLFSTISKKLLPPNTKYMPIHVEQQEFSAMSLFKDMYDKSSAVQVAVSGQLNMLDCEFQRTYILDNYTNSTNANESAPEDVESHIDEVIIKHEKQLGSSPQPQYTITNVYNQFMINDFFPSSAYNTFYIVDDDTCRVCVFNLYFESKGLNGRTQEVGRIPDSVIPADGKNLGFPATIQPQESIPIDSADVYKHYASGMYYL
ncbi:MAG: hypothetical protein EZS28_005219 [Streblomastix strix]|uniref:Uncharacterized protein n=1 Tax=Streblomastix strix TaxID=222440 RepID=A0A5J4WW65_9EUKA|nr:MAG: hypothetical protein EZS28_005219 [Streblomastix strix]